MINGWIILLAVFILYLLASIKILMADSRDDYLKRCSAEDISDDQDRRKFADVPGCDAIAAAANSGRLVDAVKQGEAVSGRISRFLVPISLARDAPDSAYTSDPRLELARVVLLDGLERAKSKSRLCGKFGEVEWEAGDLVSAAEWWIKSVRLQLKQAPDDYTPFVHLMHLAFLLGFQDLGGKLNARVQKLQFGGIQLDAASQSRMLTLLQSVDREKIPWLVMAVKRLDTLV